MMRDERTSFFRLFVMTLMAASATASATEGPVAHWIFDADHVDGQTIRDQAGSADATVTGPIKFRSEAAGGGMLLDREANRVTVPYDLSSPALPRETLSAEAWLAIDKTVEWGGIVGAASANGEKGWMLGFLQSSFSFVLSGQETKGRLDLRCRTSLEWGRWYHVVGTYDGTETRVYVNGLLANSSTEQRGPIEYPESAPFVIGSFDKFFPRSWLREVRVYDRALTPEEVADHYRARQLSFPDLLDVRVGPILRRLDRETVSIAWRTDRPSPSTLLFGDTLPLTRRIEDAAPKTAHELTVRDFAHEKLYYYRIVGIGPNDRPRASRLYEFDSTFDYTPPQVTLGENPYPKDAWTERYEKAAKRILQETGIDRGYCLVLGGGQGRLAYELAKRSDLSIICLDENEADLVAAREALDRAGLYGVRVTVRRSSLSSLSVRHYLANLIVSDSMLTGGGLPTPAPEVLRVLRPCGGVLYLGQFDGEQGKLSRADLEGWLKQASDMPPAEIRQENGSLWVVAHRPALPGGGAWTHQYGDAGNSSCSQDQYLADPVKVLWFGRPGPRPMVDRGTRAPAPLSVHGRLFVQGDRRLFGIDAYNGTILWVLELPELRRANIPRDGSNMAATQDALYIAVGDACWKIDPQTGNLMEIHPLPAGEPGKVYDWGYLAVQGDLILGSGVQRGGLFVGADGEWYDRPDTESHKVVSDFVFALDRHAGTTLWKYTGGLVINPTLAMGEGSVYLVESRNPEALQIAAGRMGKEIAKDRYLVALDATSGSKLWERPQDFSEGRWVFYLSYAKDTLIALSTSDKYHVYAFDARDGRALWQKEHNFNRDHHGGAMQHPAIVGDTVFAEPVAYHLRTGEVVRARMPGRGGCGAISASAGCLFFRDSVHAMWDLEKDTRRRFTGIRPGCWLGIIPANGVLLAPETSAGCYCANPIQTSIAFSADERALSAPAE